MESTLKPVLVETYLLGAIRKYDINVDVVYNDGLYVWEQISISADKWNYSGLVDSLISYKYPIDKMQAVINNYLLDPYDEYAVSEFNAMQAWRKESKEIAKQALLYELS